MKLFCEMTDQEIDQVNLVEFTGLKIGERVSHRNAGNHGGSGQTISSQLGTVIGHSNHGLHHWGGLCVTVSVLWDDGEQYSMDYKLALKELSKESK